MEPVKLYQLAHTNEGRPEKLIYFIFIWTAVIHNVWGWGQGFASSSRALSSVVKVSWYWDTNQKLHFFIVHLDEIQPSRTKAFQRWTVGQTPSSCLPEFVLRSLMSSWVCPQFSYVFLSMAWGLLYLLVHVLRSLMYFWACSGVFLDWIQHEKLITPESDVFNVYLSHYSYTIFREDLCLFNNTTEQFPQLSKSSVM